MAYKMVVSQGFGKQQRFTGNTPFDFVLVSHGYGFLLVNFRFTQKAPRKDILKGTNRCFAVSVQDYVIAKEQAMLDGKSSLTYDWFVHNAIECPRIREKNSKGIAESMWDLSPLVCVIN